MHIAFLGLGRMGKPMAARLLQAGYEVTIYNRNPAPADELARQGARKAVTPADAAAGAAIAITMLADDAAAREVLGLDAKPAINGRGLLAGLREGGVHISMSTLGLDCIREMAQAHARHRQGFIAAPVFGRPEAAAAGKLWVLAAGAAKDLEICRPVLRAFGQGVLEVGDDPAAANVVKIAGNFTLAAMLETLGEAMALVKQAGIAPAQFLDIIQRIYQSPVYQNYGTLIAEQRFEPAGFILRLGLKDASLTCQTAGQLGQMMPLAGLVRDRLQSAMERGWGEKDWSAFSSQ